MADPKLMSGLGAVLAMFLSALGASWASIPAGNFAVHSIHGHDTNQGFTSCIMSFGPIVISGVLAIYGTIVAALLVYDSSSSSTSSGGGGGDNAMTEADGYRHLTAGLVVGLACLASGFGLHGFLQSNLATSVTTKDGGGGNTAVAHEEQLHEPLLESRNSGATTQTRTRVTTITTVPNIKFLMVLVFLEAIGLYGLVVAIYMARVR